MLQNRASFEGVKLLACPVCDRPLSLVSAALQCERDHSFDIAREGYVHLLSSKHPGDVKEMLRARRAFLEAGFYQPLSDAINAGILRHLESLPNLPTLLDAGCGEGYYLGRLQECLVDKFPHMLVGIDISKEAIRMAAKRYKEALFVVADLKQRFVLVGSSISGIVNIFAPRNTTEFARVLIPGGLLLVVIPTSEHLLSLRALLGLLTIQEQKEQQVIAQFSEQFVLIESENIAYPLRLRGEAIEQVVMMTPNYWHLGYRVSQAMQRLGEVETGAAFTLLSFNKR